MVDVRELLRYNEEVRHKYFDTLAKLSWDRLTEDREASWHSLRNIFVHTMHAIDYWLDFLQKEHLRTGKDFEDYKTIDDVRAYMAHVEARMRTYLDYLTPERLREKHMVKNDVGETIDVTAEDVLIHVFEEEVHHRGELIALLWQMDVEPPMMGWKYL